ncbi:MAG: LD-carboxypeptidase [Oscillospiraceae bacterium]|nr:LD-carboxypeptidase [Oscillospiraceae bacterium]
MKQALCMILLFAFFTLALSQAFAETPELAAIYAAPGAKTGEENGDTVNLLYLFRDGTYKQDSVTADAEDGETGAPSYVRIYPLEGEAETIPTPAPTPETTPEPTPAVPPEETGETYDEGVDTKIEITGYTPYRGEPENCFLVPGDRIAVITPSAMAGKEQTELTVAGLRAWGFEPVLGRHVYADVRTLAECMADLRWALEDPDIKGIFCVRGGYGATEVMDALGEELIANAKKPIFGYSDITVYHGAWTRAGLPSVHACMSAAFGDFPAECADAELHLMQGQIPAYRCETDETGKPGTAEGVLIGGNLSTFTATLDTAYDSTEIEGPYILFLEEVGENMQHIHRYLTILKHRGILDNAAGIVFGEWVDLPADGRGNCGDDRGGLFASVADMINRQFLDGLDVPVAFGFPAGHGDVNYPLLMGKTARLEVSAGQFTLSWPQTDAESTIETQG